MSDLRTRTRYATSVDTEIVDNLRLLSEITRIPQARLVDEALDDLIVKYQETLQRYYAVQANKIKAMAEEHQEKMLKKTLSEKENDDL